VQDEDAPGRFRQFDFLGTVRRLAEKHYPSLCEVRKEFEGLTLVFEFIHPETRIITNYGNRKDLVLLACFDRREYRYRTLAELKEIARANRLVAVDELSPTGNTLGEQIDGLLASIAGTDQEGTVIAIERGHQLVYRVKVKSPDYLRVLKLVVTCTYAKTVEMMDAHPEWTSWADMEKHLNGLGREQVPEEVLEFYHEHYNTHAEYLANCNRLRTWALTKAEQLLKEVQTGLDEPVEPRLLRKAFAARAIELPLPALLFAAFDGRLDVAGVRQFARTPDEALEACSRIGDSSQSGVLPRKSDSGVI
jgi:hypothetical protein